MAQNKKQQPKRKPLHIKAGDEVVVISGEGRIGQTPRKVIQAFPREGKLLVEGVRVVKDTPKKGQQDTTANPQDFIEKPQPIDASNVALWDARAKRRTRVRYKTEVDGSKTRVAVKSGEAL
jgi:large subunit ribosomal protein L24